MKKLILFSCLFILLISFNLKSVLGSSTFYQNELEYNFKVDKVIKYSYDEFLYEKNMEIFYYKDSSIKISDGKILDAKIFDECIVGTILKDDLTYLFYYEKGRNKIIETKTTEEYFDFIYEENKILCAGKKNKDAVVSIYNLQLKHLASFTFGGNALEEFRHLISYNNHYYVSLYSDGISNNSCFYNMGNLGDKKSAIVKLDKEFNIIDTLYLSNGESLEVIKDFYIKDDNLYICLKTNTTYIMYKADEDFYITDYFNTLSKKEVTLLPNFKNNAFLYMDDNLALYLNNELLYKVMDHFQVYDIFVKKGVLTIYTLDPLSKLYIHKITEEDIVYSNDLVVDKLNPKYDETMHFKIQSFFDNYIYKLKDISPLFDKRIHGKYIAHYECITSGNVTLNHETNLYVNNYTNFCDKGIYPQGYILEFFGKGKLNEQNIFYGYVLNELGTFTIEIEDINKNKQTYELEVVSDYYTNQKSEFIDVDCYVSYPEKAVLSIQKDKTYHNEFVDYVIVNGMKYNDFKEFNDHIEVYFNHPAVCLNRKYNIEGVVYKNGLYASLFKSFSVCYLKEEPKLFIKRELNNKDLIVDIDVEDPYLTFCYLKEINEQNKTTYIHTNTNTLYKENKQIYLCYNIGNKEIKEINLLDLSKTGSDSYINYELTYKEGHLTNIKIKVKLFDKNFHNDKVLLFNNNVLDYVTKPNPIEPFMPFIKSSIIILLSIPLYIIYKLCKKKRVKKIS